MWLENISCAREYQRYSSQKIWYDKYEILNKIEKTQLLFTAITTNTRPQGVFSFGSNLPFGGRQSTVTMVFTRWPREDSFPVSQALGGKCRCLSRVCNIILLQDLTPLHVKITRSTNLWSV